MDLLFCQICREVTGWLWDEYVISSGVTSTGLVLDEGEAIVRSGGVLSRTTINGGGVLVSRGGIADKTEFNDGWLEVYSGGTATNIDWTPCTAELQIYDSAYVTFAGHLAGCYYGSDDQLLSSAMTMNDKAVNGEMYIMQGGKATNTTINYGGDLYVFSGGVASNTVITCAGDMYVYSGGTAKGITLQSRGCLDVSSGGTATNIADRFLIRVLDSELQLIHYQYE